jgi:hypothetical protein
MHASNPRSLRFMFEIALQKKSHATLFFTY